MYGSNAYDDMVSSFFTEQMVLRERADFYEKWGASGGRKSIWTCKDGTKVRICDMSDSHLENAINFLQRKDPGSEALTYLNHEYFYRNKYQELLKELHESEEVSDMCF